MKHMIRQFVASLTLALLMTVPAVGLVAAPAGAAPQPIVASASTDAACNGIGLGEDCGGAQSGKDINGVIKVLLQVLSVVVGVIAVIMIVIGGFKFITANGDSNKLASARSTIIYAIIGLVVVALSQIVVFFVLNKVK